MNSREIGKIIKEVYDGLTLNSFKMLDDEGSKLFDEPFFGVSKGNDEYYEFLKEHIGTFHWLPKEVLALKYGDKVSEVDSENIRVITMIFPQTEKTRVAQRKAVHFPSDEWRVSREDWEALMVEFSGKLVNILEESFNKVVSIDLQPEFETAISENQGIASKWSHRHGAYAAGLGTFSLSDGLITEKGMAHRITTTVIEIDPARDDLEITGSEESRPGIRDNCLSFRGISCNACIKRCPIDAISKAGHDKGTCDTYEDYCISNYWPENVEYRGLKFGCGLCQVKIPCEFENPTKRLTR